MPGRESTCTFPRTVGSSACRRESSCTAAPLWTRAIVAACFQQRLVRGDDVSDVLARLPRARRRHLIALAAADAAGGGGSHSLAEIDFARLCRSHRLPEPSRQLVRYDTTGRRRYLDVHFTEWRVIVEIDGGQHLDPRQAWADMQRQNELWVAGDRIIRFPTWALRTRPAEVLTQLRAALIAAGWPGQVSGRPDLGN